MCRQCLLRSCRIDLSYHYNIKYGILGIMRAFWNKIKQAKVLWIVVIIAIQTVVYVVAGVHKAYYHMDEMYSYGLANFKQVQIYETEDFYNEWHTADYYRDYLVVDEGERGDFAPVYNNQRDDVHPPLYYLLLRVGMEMTPGEFSKWTGIIINIAAFAVNTVFLYLIALRLVRKEANKELKAFVVTLVAAVSLCAVSTVLYIRMYALLTMWVTLTMWLHLVLVESKRLRPGLLVTIGVVALMGVLTQYYYVFFLLPLFMIMVVRYAKAKRMRELWAYVGTLAGAAVVSLVIWPYSIQHMFFGYRGVGVLGNLLNFMNLGVQLGVFCGMVVLYMFHGLLPLMLVVMFGLAIYGVRHAKRLELSRVEEVNYGLVLWPTVVFFLIAAVASPFQDLRYIEAVGGLMIIVVLYGLYRLVGMVASGRMTQIVMLVTAAAMLIAPVVLGLEPDVMYRRMETLNKFVAENAEAPAIYLYNPGNERFLDDLVSFTEIEESYIMHHQAYTEENFERILAGKDLTEGLIVFANYGDENERWLEILRAASGLERQEYVVRTNSADVYYLSAM